MISCTYLYSAESQIFVSARDVFESFKTHIPQSHETRQPFHQIDRLRFPLQTMAELSKEVSVAGTKPPDSLMN